MEISVSDTTVDRWKALGYLPVRGIADRRIARFLRTQRKNMRRFFAERGLFDELEKMERIRKSRQGMMAKNRMFQEVLDAYAARTSPAATGPETTHPKDQGNTDMAVHAPSESGGSTPVLDPGTGSQPGARVSGVAGHAGDEPVIEE